MHENRKQSLGRRIKKYRLKANLTQLDLGIMIGHYSAAYISFVEKGQRNINAIDLALLAKKLRVSTDELLK